MKTMGKLGEEKVRCPKCGKEMLADLHRGRYDAWIELDNWWCEFCHILIDRKDFK